MSSPTEKENPVGTKSIDDAGASAGYTLVDSITGQSAVVLSTAAQTGGEFAEVEVVWTPATGPSPERCFATHEVRFEVLEGRLAVQIEGVPRVLRAGEAVTLPPGTRHRIDVDQGASTARFLWRIRPAPDHDDLLARALGTEGRAQDPSGGAGADA